MYNNFYECIFDLGNILGVSRLDQLETAVKFALENDFPKVAQYFQENYNRLNWHIRKEFEDVADASVNETTNT